MKSSLVLPLLLVLQTSAPPTAEVRIDSTNVSIGDRFAVTIEVTGPDGATYDFPREISTGSVDLRLSTKPGSRPGTATYDAQVFALGDEAVIPDVSISYRLADGTAGSIATSPQKVNIVSTLDPQEKEPAPADVAPPVTVLVARAFWVASSILVLLSIAAFVWLIRKIRFPKKAADPVATPALSPEEEALLDLDKLATGRAAISPRDFYIRITQVLKRYLERRLEAPVLEMTSAETLALIKSQAWTAPHAVALRDLVNFADLVKFGGVSEMSNSDRQIQLVRDVVARIDRLRRAELDIQAAEEKRKTA
jgi:hypothetical protein